MASTTSIRHQVQGLNLISTLARDVLQGEFMVRPLPGDDADLPTASANTEDAFGVVDEPAGGSVGQVQPLRFVRSGEINARAQDNAAIAADADLMLSGTDLGSIVTAAGSGSKICARALEASPATTPQFIRIEVHCLGKLPEVP